MSEKMKQIPIGEIVRRVNLDGLSQSIVISFLKDDETYGGRIKDTIFNGTVVEGTDEDCDKIVSFIKEKYDPTDELMKKGVDSLNTRQEIELLRRQLNVGDEYYEYKTLSFEDSAFMGNVDRELIDIQLNKLALEGWRLKDVTRQEIGAAYRRTLLFLERRVVVE